MAVVERCRRLNRRVTVLKKAGIVVAAAAAGLLAVSPLAFASDGHGILDGAHGQVGLVNVQDSAVQVPIQACNNSVIEGVLGVLAKNQKNSDSHDGECHQKNKAVDSAGSSDDDD
ncbi:MAG TPA: hypothetical protein VGH72_19765 [Pseudonocardia sp.]|jgi:hypothetical protein